MALVLRLRRSEHVRRFPGQPPQAALDKVYDPGSCGDDEVSERLGQEHVCFFRPAWFVERVVWIAIIRRLLNDEVSPPSNTIAAASAVRVMWKFSPSMYAFQRAGMGSSPQGSSMDLVGSHVMSRRLLNERSAVGSCREVAAFAAHADDALACCWVADVLPLHLVEANVLEPRLLGAGLHIAWPRRAAVQVDDALPIAGPLRAHGVAWYDEPGRYGFLRAHARVSPRWLRTCSL